MNSKNKDFKLGDKVEIMIDYDPLFYKDRFIEKRYFGTIDRELYGEVYHVKEAQRWFLSKDLMKIK